MESLLKGLFLFIAFPAASAFAQTPIPCISHANLEKIAQSFPQFQASLGGKAEYCEADMGAQSLQIANSMTVLINTQPNEPALDVDDALSLKAISENNWWSYFTARAKVVVVQLGCPEGAIAFVRPMLGDSTVQVCEMFFKMSTATQASVLMHEVRHFDGHGHVTCTQGFESGSGGACDEDITLKGSYAVGVQTLVGMARSAATAPADKPALEAEAIYSAFNKFNVVPKVRINNSIILSNTNSEVFKWDLNKAEATLLKTLTEPAIVANSNNMLTIFPVNVNSDAYRKDITLQTDIENPGLYAKQYNAETPEERAKYKTIAYGGTGGLLKGNSLFALCGPDTVLTETNLDAQGKFTGIITMSDDVADLFKVSLLVTEKGELVRYNCQDAETTVVKFEKTELKLNTNGAKVVSSFGLGGEQYAVMDDGSLGVLFEATNTLTLQSVSMPIANQNWVSAAPFSRAEVF